MINKQGSIISVTINENDLVKYIKQSYQLVNGAKIANRIMLQAGLEGSEDFYKQEFNTLI